MKRMYYFSSALVLMLIANFSFANFINVQNTTLTGQNTTTQQIQVQFDLSWNNSWRDSINYDGAWVFVKYRIGTGNWTHANLDTLNFLVGTGTAHAIRVAPLTNTAIRPGAMIWRTGGGSGTFNATGIQLSWRYGNQGVTNTDALTAQLRVFAIEMVYIPQGNYFLGSANNTRNNFYNGTNSAQPLQITGTGFSNSLGSNLIGNWSNTRFHGVQGLDGNNDGSMASGYPTDNPDYPIGWKAFWIMKYEISQGQYADFLNTLTYLQQSTRFPGGDINTVNNNIQNNSTTDPNRYTLRIGTAGVNPGTPRVVITVRPDRGCNFLSWPDGCAYADWAGLRMMSELEYEKAGRGFLNSVINEYAWGTTTGVLGNTLSGTENGTETVTEAGANFSNIAQTRSGGDGNTGPLRVGIHATATSTRTQAGSSYFGVMDMTGNLFEMYVNVQHNQGRSYRGDHALWHGDGTLTTAGTQGAANVANWTGNGGVTVNVATTPTDITQGGGVVQRGTNGSWTSGSDDYRLTDRMSTGSATLSGSTNYVDMSGRDYRYGQRLGRSGFH